MTLIALWCTRQKVKRFKQESVTNGRTDRRTDGQTDASKCIISLASRSIKIRAKDATYSSSCVGMAKFGCCEVWNYFCEVILFTHSDRWTVNVPFPVQKAMKMLSYVFKVSVLVVYWVLITYTSFLMPDYLQSCTFWLPAPSSSWSPAGLIRRDGVSADISALEVVIWNRKMLIWNRESKDSQVQNGLIGLCWRQVLDSLLRVVITRI